MRARRTTLALLAVGGVVLLGASPVGADAPVDQGWWTTANPGPPLPAQAPPDVPEDGLLVQGGPGGPTALAALVYEVEGEATELVLTVAPSTATTPAAVLQLCPLTSGSITAEQGGPMANAPEYDCASPVEAEPGDDGKTYTFDVSTLALGGPLAFAILPTAPSTRVVLTKPGDESLVAGASTGSGGSTPTGGGSGGFTAEEPTTGSAEAPPMSGTSTEVELPAGEAITGSAPLDQAPEVAAEPAQPEIAAEPAAEVAAVPAAATSGAGDSSRKTLLLFAALAAGAVLWTAAGRARPEDDAEPAAA